MHVYNNIHVTLIDCHYFGAVCFVWVLCACVLHEKSPLWVPSVTHQLHCHYLLNARVQQCILGHLHESLTNRPHLVNWLNVLDETATAYTFDSMESIDFRQCFSAFQTKKKWLHYEIWREKTGSEKTNFCNKEFQIGSWKSDNSVFSHVACVRI